MRTFALSSACWLAYASSVLGALYYVSNSGNDGNAGTSPTAAWKSLAKVNRFSFAPGDVVLFERGGVWRGAGDVNPFFPREFEAYQRFTAKDAGSRLVNLQSCVLKPSKLTLRVGESHQVQAVAVYSDGTSADATPIARFVSEDSSAVSVTPGGRVHAVRPGTASVTATIEDRAARMTVVVQPRKISSANKKGKP